MRKTTVTNRHAIGVLEPLSFVTDPDARHNLSSYREMLIKGRAAAGLTSLRDPAEIDRRHIGESLVLLEFLEARGLFASPERAHRDCRSRSLALTCA